MDATTVVHRPADQADSPRSKPSDALARFHEHAARTAAGRSTPTLSRHQILDATEACLKETGYDGATIRRIAGRLDCAVGTIYRYFKDKRQLLMAVVQRRFEAVAEQAHADTAPQHSARLYLRQAAAEPQQYRLMFWLASTDHQASAMPEVVRQIIDGWTRQFEDQRLAERFWAEIHGSLMLGIAPDDALQRAFAVVPAAAQPTA